jgi:tetratricopeptide (TPR) repeat protein
MDSGRRAVASPPARDRGGEDAAASSKRVILALCFALCALTLLIFSRTLTNDFLPLDTRGYVNEWVKQGLTIDNVLRAFSGPVHGFWAPVTIVSHMIDCELHGPQPWGHHLSSLLLHAVNAGAVFLLLVAATGRVWPSALVAALFAWHPTRVESVAWIAERRDLLSGLFGFLSIAAYLRFTRHRRASAYAACAAFLALSLMAKPMLVTLPFLLILLDMWPLGRLSGTTRRDLPRALGGLFREKLPLLAIVSVIVAIAVYTQSEVGAVHSLAGFSASNRVWKSSIAYLEYGRILFWPLDLSILYPLRFHRLNPWNGLLALTALAAVTFCVTRSMARRPYLCVGWYWFIGTLLPVIGIVQVGSQSIADRFTYFPAIGLFVMVAFGLDEWATSRRRKQVAVAGAIGWLCILGGLTASYAEKWRDPETLFRHGLASIGESHQLRRWLATELILRGRLDEAVQELDRSIQIRPTTKSYFKRAEARKRLGEIEGAKDDLRRGLELAERKHPRWEIEGLLRLGEIHRKQGEWRQAEERYRQTLDVYPYDGAAAIGLATVLLRTCRGKTAIELLHAASQAHPGNASVLRKLAWVRATHPDPGLREPAEARQLATRACELTGYADSSSLDALAAAQAALGDFDAALISLDRARQVLARSSRGRPSPYRAALDGRRALYAKRRPFIEDRQPCPEGSEDP